MNIKTFLVCLSSFMLVGPTIADETSPLPQSDGQPADMTKPVQVFILLGEANMLGLGAIQGSRNGALEHAVKSKGLYPYLVDEQGKWTQRRDARLVQVSTGPQGALQIKHNEWLTVSGSTIGPEIGIGHHLADAIDAPVLILKSCAGNRSLGWDLLPPGSPSFELGGKVYAGYRESPSSWNAGEEPEPLGWHAGKQYDEDVRAARMALNDLGTLYPGATDYEIAGFLWWQGNKDHTDAVYAGRYEQNLVRLIQALREDLKAPNARFVCATLGQTQKGATGPAGMLLDAKMAVDGNSGKYPEFSGNVATVYTHPLAQGTSSNGFYGRNAEVFMDVGEAMAKAMIGLLE